MREAAQQAHDVLRRLGIEARHRLVGQHHQRSLRQRARDRHALRLAAGQGAGALLRQMRQPDLAQVVARRRQLLGRQPAERGPPGLVPAQRAAGDVGQHAAPAHQVGVLRDHRQVEPRAAQLLAGEAGDLGAVQPDLARGRRQRAGDAAQQRGLAAAVAAQHDQQLARPHLQLDIRPAPACRSGSAATAR